METIKSIKGKMNKWHKRIKVFNTVKKIVDGLIKIAGPAMSLFLLVDGFLNKATINEKQPVEPIDVYYN